MAFLKFICPRCHQPALLDSIGQCSTVLKDGSFCGFSLPIQYDDGNNKYKTKMEKHTTVPASGVTGQYSWVDSSGTYPFCQQTALDQGSLHLDRNRNYLFLFATPSGSGPLARVFYASAGTIGSASGVIMPLNSKPQNLHHFYDNYQPHFQHIADGTELVVSAPDANHSDYRVEHLGVIIYRYDPVTRTECYYPPPSLPSGLPGPVLKLNP